MKNTKKQINTGRAHSMHMDKTIFKGDKKVLDIDNRMNLEVPKQISAKHVVFGRNLMFSKI